MSNESSPDTTVPYYEENDAKRRAEDYAAISVARRAFSRWRRTGVALIVAGTAAIGGAQATSGETHHEVDIAGTAMFLIGAYVLKRNMLDETEMGRSGRPFVIGQRVLAEQTGNEDAPWGISELESAVLPQAPNQERQL